LPTEATGCPRYPDNGQTPGRKHFIEGLSSVSIHRFFIKPPSVGAVRDPPLHPGALYPNLSEKKILAPLWADLAAALTYGLTSINILPVMKKNIEP
jgi:hypothetical protein